MSADRYCVDTSALIDGIQRYYRPDNFPGVWKHIDELIDDGRFFVSREVAEEVKAKDDDVFQWMNGRGPGFILETEADVIVTAQTILQTNPKLVKAYQSRTSADTFVVSLAEHQSAIVVTGEGDGSPNRPTIPYVCGARGIECITLPEVVTREGWSF